MASSSAFWEAVEDDDVEMARSLIEKGIYEKDREPQPLHVAVQNNSIHICQMLVEQGYDVNKGDSDGDCPLHLAMSEEVSIEILQCLLKAKADVNLVNQLGESPLHVAALNGSTEKVSVLLQCQDINTGLLDYEMNTALHLLLTNEEVSESELAHVTEKLLESGININTQNKYDKTPLITASEHEILEVVLFLIESNAVLVLVDNGGDNFLQKLEHLDETSIEKVLKICFKMSGDATSSVLNQQNISGKAPFHWIAIQCSLDLIEQCLEYGAKINIKDYLGQTAIHLFPEEETIELLLHRGADVSATDANGRTILHKVTTMGLLRKILDNGGESLINAQDKCGITPLHEFVKCDEEMIKLLLDKGGEINIVDMHGSSLLHYAVWYSAPEIYDLLIVKGIDSTRRDALGFLADDVLPDSESMSLASLFPTFASSMKECCRINNEDDISDKNCGKNRWTECASAYALRDEQSVDRPTVNEDATGDSVLETSGSECQEPHSIEDTKDGVSTYETLGGKITTKHSDNKVSVVSVIDYSDFKGIPSENDISKLLEVEKNRISVSSLLQDPLRGLVSDNDEAMEIKDNVIRLMEKALSKVAEYDERFSASLLHTGSSSEGTRVCQPNEFDFICFLDSISAICEIQESSIFQLDGFSQAKRKMNVDKTDFAEFFDRCNKLNSEQTRERFQQLFKAALHQESTWQGTSLYLEYFADLADKPTLNADVRWVGCKYKSLDISIDIVPAIYRKGFWPSTVDMKSCSLMTPTIKDAGCALLLQQPSSVPEKLLEDKDSVMRISCAPAEVALFKEMPLTLKRSYALAKILLRSDVCPTFHFDGEIMAQQLGAGNYISSYMLKNCLLHVISDDPNVMADLRPISDDAFIKYWTVQIFQYLRKSAKYGKLVPYFFQQTDIFSFEYKQLSDMDEEMTSGIDNTNTSRRLYFTDLIIQILNTLIVDRKEIVHSGSGAHVIC